MTAWQEPAPAKVNLFLHVTGRRPDGYHLLDSLAVFPEIGDILSAEPAPTLSLTLTGPFAASLAAEDDNLVLRAARMLAEASPAKPQGARLVLDKQLPVASGIGGGSADAAAALRLLARMWSVPEPGPAVAARLGADVPVCLHARTARMQGVGDILALPPTLPECGMVLVNPGLALSTQAVFRSRTGDFSPQATLPTAWPDAATMARDLAATRNDLEPPAIALCPQIGTVLAALRAHPNCLLARMSGSGATCFALFPTPTQAATAAHTLAAPAWWVWGGGLKQARAGLRPDPPGAEPLDLTH